MLKKRTMGLYASRDGRPPGVCCPSSGCFWNSVAAEEEEVLVQGVVVSVANRRSLYDQELNNIALHIRAERKQYHGEVFLRAIRRFYELDKQCLDDTGAVNVDRANQLAATVRGDVIADNEEENQLDVPVYSVLMSTILHDEAHTVRVRPVAGTDLGSGYTSPSRFYSRVRSVGRVDVEYSQLVLFLLDAMLTMPGGCPNFPDYFLQVFEACFNCIGRHKEAFEHIMRGYIATQIPQRIADADLPVPNPPAAAPEPTSPKQVQTTLQVLFAAWIDTYKIDCLNAVVIHPLLFLFRTNYTVYENLASHGTSFWATVTEACLGIPMPQERLLALDSGWSWGARCLPDSDPLVCEVLRRCMSQVGVNWRTALQGLTPPCSQSHIPECELLYSCGNLGRLEEAIRQNRLSVEERKDLAPTLQRFVSLLSPALVGQAFLRHLLSKLDALPPSLQALCPTQYVDATDPENIVYDDEGIAAMLHRAGISVTGAEVQWG